MDALVVPLGELDRSAVAIAGGKAANLGELLRAGFPVPDGVCLTTEVYKRFVAATGIAPRLAEGLASLDAQDPENLARVGAAIRELFAEAALPEDIAAVVTSAWRMVALEPAGRLPADEPRQTAVVGVEHPLAVRSSATAEDLPEASFAGQLESHLNVRGEEALRTAVQRCWGSLWTDRAIAYREHNGIAHQDVSLAVVVQRLVPAEAAGVLFTANPVSGKRTEIVVEASFGLGDAVVSGLTSPDKYVVDKTHLRILTKETGAKAVQTTALPGGGTAVVPTKGVAGERQALPDEAILELARLAKKIEEHFGSPQDVEWAWAKGQLQILQSRPVTALYPAPPPAPEDELRVYLSMNLIQGVPDPFTPMGASLFSGMAQSLWSEGKDGVYTVIELGNRLYLDITGILKSELGKKWVTAALPQAEPVAAGILEHLMDDPRLRAKKRPGKWAMARLLLTRGSKPWPLVAGVARFVVSPWAARRRLDKSVVLGLAAWREEMDREAVPGREGLTIRHALHVGLKERFLPHLLPPVIAGMLCYALAASMVRRNGLDKRLLTKARQGLPFNKTTIMDLELWALAELASQDAAATAAIADADPEELAARFRRRALPAVLQGGMEAFLDRYGHRALREIDIGLPRWREEPAYLFGLLKNYAMIDAAAAPDKHFARQAAAGEKALAGLVSQMRSAPGGWWKARLLRFSLQRYRQIGGLRETPKFYLVWTFEAVRLVLLRTGKRLATEGWLDRPEDVFFLRVEELDEPEPREERWRQLILNRRKAFDLELRRQHSPRVITSEGEAFYGEASATESGGLAGTAVSPGVARGRARVVRNPVGVRLQPGEILVAPATDPAWTPLFLTAGGLVMETGGMMSHGATVAREYGIPAVAGVVGATGKIADGQQVEVDGNTGLVRVTNQESASGLSATKAA